MDLGPFSISLAVRDLQASKEFYEKLGFSVMGGDQSENWLILVNRRIVIGLFQGMFEQNILTFTPGLDPELGTVDEFTDVRDLRKALEAAGLEVEGNTDESESGPAHLTLTDPDGNPILIDQHV